MLELERRGELRYGDLSTNPEDADVKRALREIIADHATRRFLSEKAARLCEKWGAKPCDHPKLEKEYFLSAQSGDYICVQCGTTFTPKEADELSGTR